MQGVRERDTWVDAAKGVAIILVVLTHAYGYSAIIGAESELWRSMNALFATLRMPMFFMLAGLFATSWIGRSWSELLRGKVILLMWVYLLWVIVRFLFFSLVPSLIYPSESGSLVRLFAQAVWSSMPTWFLYALAAFFVAAKALSKLRAITQLVATGAISIVFMADLITLPSSLWTGLAEYFFFFLLGAHGNSIIRTRAKTFGGKTVAFALVPIWIAAAWLCQQANLLDVIGVRFALSILALPAGVGLGLLLSRGRLTAYLGKNTMPIYLAHSLVLGGVAVLLSGLPLDSLQTMAAWLTPALTVASVAVSLGVHWLLMRMNVRGVYETPGWLDRKIAPRGTSVATP